ncbi:MAG: hypothetical protein ABFS32_23325 [Bacteroidota bacterium]
MEIVDVYYEKTRKDFEMKKSMVIGSFVLVVVLLLVVVKQVSAETCEANKRCVFNDCGNPSAQSPCDNKEDDWLCVGCTATNALPVCSFIDDNQVQCQILGLATDCGDMVKGKCDGGECKDTQFFNSNCGLDYCTTNY